MNSRICTGFVMHERFEKVSHRFTYPVCFFVIDLDELHALDKSIIGLGHNRFAPISFSDTDYLQRGSGDLREKLQVHLKAKGLSGSVKRIFLVTGARVFGHVFNPVSFYYCYDDEGQLTCIVMEVNNTFGEKHVYVLSERLEGSAPEIFHARAAKEFHVSPFFDRRGLYDCRFSPLEKEIDIHINLFKDEKPALVSRWWGSAKPLTSGNLWSVFSRYAFSMLLTLPRIHYQALKLYFLKKIKHYKKPTPLNSMTIRTQPPKLKHKIAMRFILNFLSNIAQGKLVMLLPDGRSFTFGSLNSRDQAILKINHYDFFWKVLSSAGIGLGEAYRDHDWESPDPIQVLNLLIANKETLQKKEGFLGRVSGFYNRIFHLLRSNSIMRSQKNIGEHYDLSNDFFELFLDEKMMYSCAYYRDPEESLSAAQLNKITHIIKKAKIESHHHILEIGFGWGGFAIEAVKQTGCRVTGISLSKEQLAFATARIREEGLEDKIELLLCDYRNLRGQFDRIVSIEMLEAVGHDFLGEYFKACDRLLKKDGIGVFQVITIPDQRYEDYRKSCDFIQKHIFPGGHLPSLTALAESMTRSSEFFIEDLENIGEHYADTLKAWRLRFMERQQDILALGFDERFISKWEYYFLYCEAAFRKRYLNNLQLVLTRPANKDLMNHKEKIREYAG